VWNTGKSFPLFVVVVVVVVVVVAHLLSLAVRASCNSKHWMIQSNHSLWLSGDLYSPSAQFPSLLGGSGR
jgi:hypothetical protein